LRPRRGSLIHATFDLGGRLGPENQGRGRKIFLYQAAGIRAFPTGEALVTQTDPGGQVSGNSWGALVKAAGTAHPRSGEIG
jgi:hypothetical protein